MELSNKEIVELKSTVSPLVAKATSYQITDAESVDTASLFLKEVADAKKNLEKKRLEFTAPLNQSLSAINETFRNLKQPLDEAANIVGGNIMAWRRMEQERAAKEEARRRAIQAAHEKAGHQVSAPVVMERPEAKIGNTQTRKVWKWKVVDFAKVPDNCKEVNEVFVNNQVRSGIREIPGIEVYQVEQLAIVGR